MGAVEAEGGGRAEEGEGRDGGDRAEMEGGRKKVERGKERRKGNG